MSLKKPHTAGETSWCRTCRTVPPAELHQDKACPGIPLWENRIFIPNNQNPGQNQSASKTVPELATHWHSRGPQSKLHASSAVLGWGLATTGGIGMAPSHRFSPAIFYRQMCDGTFSPAIFYRQICDGTFSP